MLKIGMILMLLYSTWGWSLDLTPAGRERFLEMARQQSTLASNKATAPAKSPYIFLFNHYLAPYPHANVSAQEREIQRTQILKQLVDFLINDQQGSASYFEVINQEENDRLLQMIVAAQLKQNDLLQLIEDYRTQKIPELKKLCQSTSINDQITCKDGSKVLRAFQQMQSRLEEIESGLRDLKGLPKEVQSFYSLHSLLCYYSWYKNKSDLEAFKRKTIQEHHALAMQLASSYKDEPSIVDLLKTSLLGYQKEDTPSAIPALSDSEMNNLLLGGWSQRLIVVRCAKKEAIEKRKRYLKAFYIQHHFDPSRLGL